MCSALLQYSMFVGAFESLLKSLLNVGFLEMKNFNEQTTVRQLSETLDISAVFSRMFTFE